MEIFISINGVLRNIIEKFEYHYNESFLESEIQSVTSIDVDTNEELTPEPNDFTYSINVPITNKNLQDHFLFQSKDEFEEFFYIEYPLEIFGHAKLSYLNVMSELNTLIYDHPEHNFTIVGLDELAKAKPSTLFFLSRNGFLGNNIKFIKSDEIKKAWRMCDMWISDDEKVLSSCPKKHMQKFRVKKKAVKFNTIYNQHFTIETEINKLTEIKQLWLKSLESSTTLM